MGLESVERASSQLRKVLAAATGKWLGWMAFAVIAYLASMYATSGFVWILGELGVFHSIDATSYALIVRIVLYVVLVAMLIGVPAWWHRRISRKQAGLDRVMEWRDIGLGIAGLMIYFLLAMVALALLRLIPGVDASQAQQLDVGQVYGTARIWVFIVLVVVTPFAEEFVFRGVLYGGLRARRVPAWAGALIVSVLFGLAHGQLNVAVDVFCLSMVACYARELTGSIWAGVVLHMIKNCIAFIIVFMIS